MKIRGSVIVSLLGITLCGVIPHANVTAQEYKYEIGGAAGTSFYMGDANRTKFYLHPGMAGGLLFRYNLNFLWSIRTGLSVGNISGKSSDSGNVFPFGRQVSFQRALAEVSAQAEFNFFPYSDKYAYLGTKPYTPYLLSGVGTTYATGDNSLFDANFSFGLGFKYKIRNRMNIGIEFSMRKLLSDKLDVTKNNSEWNLDSPYGIESSFLKNRDWYSFTMVFLTWEFGIREDPCHGN